MDLQAMNILENNKAMMALTGDKVCMGVPKYRSSLYNPDPRYEGCNACSGFQNLYVPPTEDILTSCMKRKPNMYLYNMPRRSGGNNLKIISECRGNSNEISCTGRSAYPPQYNNDNSCSYPHRDVETLHRNLREANPNYVNCSRKPVQSSCFTCMDCGCSFLQRAKANSHNCNRSRRKAVCQDSGNPLVVQVSCSPDTAKSNETNGRNTYFFRFNIQQSNPCENNNSPPPQPQCNEQDFSKKDFSSPVWWDSQSTAGQCQNKNQSCQDFRNNTQRGNKNFCTIPGKNGRPESLECHYCFDLNQSSQNKNSCSSAGNNNNKCNQAGSRQQKSLHGGSCVCAMCERLRSETRKRPHYYSELNRCKENNPLYANINIGQTDYPSIGGSCLLNQNKVGATNCSGPHGPLCNCINTVHGPLCGCTDHQKCLNSKSSFGCPFGINCFRTTCNEKQDSDMGNMNAMINTNNDCECICHDVAPDNWELDTGKIECTVQSSPAPKCYIINSTATRGKGKTDWKTNKRSTEEKKYERRSSRIKKDEKTIVTLTEFTPPFLVRRPKKGGRKF